MARGPRNAPGGVVYHVLNRAVGRQTLFHKPADFDAFERILFEALDRVPMRILSYVVMPNHWHIVLWPLEDGHLTGYVRWLTNTHTQRWHAHYHSAGTGHVYQGRFKSLPVQDDSHLLVVCRYVERNPLRANLAERAQLWRWSSLWRREHQQAARLLNDWPVPRPPDWAALVNEPPNEAELTALRYFVRRSCPFGTEPWQRRTAVALGLEATLRPRGRPAKPKPVLEV